VMILTDHSFGRFPIGFVEFLSSDLGTAFNFLGLAKSSVLVDASRLRFSRSLAPRNRDMFGRVDVGCHAEILKFSEPQIDR